ncbi:transcriptional regulator [Streptomyces spinoverrucosus]|uniref:Transcriptional regulator n=1 Tax=Streptomyces spinoverrucosus TaxID=284043 RepID=A0A4Y3VQB4_9ACTN|nr:helix-turn-helix transcriptional regulator [Streptomyces spinoverrucosus]GEC09202.1 transcriptional regulator [Streptomyces spinoverrucosus]GHB66397.1 transcriptional regulator [Streptomyces spinoverrucosus]
MDQRPDNRSEIRDFLATRRAKITPEQAGLPTSGRRRVPGLRREEVAVLAGVSTEWYTRLEKGHISGVSEDVLDAVARALQLDEDERTYLFDLAMAAQPSSRTPRRRKAVDIPPRVQWLLDSITLSAAFVTNGRLDIVATNALARALFSPLFDSETTDERGRPNFARYWFLDPGSHHFIADWDGATNATAALLRAEAGRYPQDKALRELIGELSTVSAEFRTRWAAHNVRIHHGGVKRFHHPDAGPLELTYQPLDMPLSTHEAHALTIYTAEPGTPDEDRLKLLASWAATPAAPQTPPTRRADTGGPSR